MRYTYFYTEKWSSSTASASISQLPFYFRSNWDKALEGGEKKHKRDKEHGKIWSPFSIAAAVLFLQLAVSEQARRESATSLFPMCSLVIDFLYE